MWSKTAESSKHRVTGDIPYFCEHGIDLVLLVLIVHDNFLKRFVRKLGMQCVCLFYTALQLSIPVRNPHSAASKSMSCGYKQFSFHKNFACCFKNRLSEHRLCMMLLS